jgi:hypothetical protein
VPAMHVVSHQTDWVVVAWVHMAFFLIPFLAFATVGRQDRRVYPAPPLRRRPVHT